VVVRVRENRRDRRSLLFLLKKCSEFEGFLFPSPICQKRVCHYITSEISHILAEERSVTIM